MTPRKHADVSILMTAFNSGEYVADAIDSILQQSTRYAWELIFVDDGSTDGTLRIAQSYAQRFPCEVRVFQHAGGRNLGISASRNLALSYANGRFLAFLDSDDVWLPHHLETQVALLETMPHVAMVYAAAERWVHFDAPFDEVAARASCWGENYLPPLVPEAERAGLLRRGALLKWTKRDESFVPCICTVVARTGIVRSVGAFCDQFRGLYDDQVLHARIASRHDVYANDCCVARYRQHPSSCCAQARLRPLTQCKESDRFEKFLQDEIVAADPFCEEALAGAACAT